MKWTEIWPDIKIMNYDRRAGAIGASTHCGIETLLAQGIMYRIETERTSSVASIFTIAAGPA